MNLKAQILEVVSNVVLRAVAVVHDRRLPMDTALRSAVIDCRYRSLKPLLSLALVVFSTLAFPDPLDAQVRRAPEVHEAFSQLLPQLDGRRLKVSFVEVTYPPGGSSSPHIHHCPVVVYVIAGAIRSQLQGEPERIYGAGESFYEAPNGVHAIAANASNKEPAKFLACFICDREEELSVPLTNAIPPGGFQP